jgi:hypothetical protein
MATDVKAGAAYVELLLRNEKFVAGLKRSGQMLMGFAKGAAVAGAAIAAAGTAAAVVGVKNFLDFSGSLKDMSDRTGMSVESLSELRHAAKMSGTDIGTVEKALKKMQQQGMNVSDFDKIAANIAAIEDPTKKAQAAMEAWGARAGPALLPMLQELPKLRQEARDLGLVMSDETATRGAKLGDMLDALWETLYQGSIAVGAAFAPFLEVALPAIQTFVTEGVLAIQGWATSMADNVGSVTSFIGAVWSTTMEWWRGLQAKVLSGVVYLWDNWKTLLEISITSGIYSVVKFANQTMYFFSEVIPGYLSWFADNWYEVFTDIVNITATMAGNIWTNLKNLWSSIVGLFSGEGFSFEWTPLTEGFKSAIKELPKIAEREIGPLEQGLADDLAKLGDQVVKGWDTHLEKLPELTKEFVGEADPVAEMIEKGKSQSAERDKLVGDATPVAGQAKSQVFGSFSAAAIAAQGSGGGSGDPGADRVVAAVEKAAEAQKQRDDQARRERKNEGGLE